jgi:hypothetical protein
MVDRYNKRHVQISVAAAGMLGIGFGFWIGKRIDVAGFVETIIVWLAFVLASSIVFSRIDAKHLPQDDP